MYFELENTYFGFGSTLNYSIYNQGEETGNSIMQIMPTVKTRAPLPLRITKMISSVISDIKEDNQQKD